MEECQGERTANGGNRGNIRVGMERITIKWDWNPERVKRR